MDARADIQKRHILVVDDQVTVRASLRRNLEEAGFLVMEAGSKAQVLSLLDQRTPIDLISLDLRLGDDDGLMLAREIRERRNIPIIMITALTAPLDRVTGLEHGADDYIVKPFHSREVVMRIESVLRRYELEARIGIKSPAQKPIDEIYVSDAGVADVRNRTLTSASGEQVPLTDAEFDILIEFLRSPARILSRDELSLALKGRRWSPTDRTLDGHIARLRKKIEADIEHPTLIRTVWRVGYVFSGDVQRRGS